MEPWERSWDDRILIEIPLSSLWTQIGFDPVTRGSSHSECRVKVRPPVDPLFPGGHGLLGWPKRFDNCLLRGANFLRLNTFKKMEEKMKKVLLIVLVFICCAGSFIGLIHLAYSEPSCTGPFRQSNGCDHYVCVGDDGRSFCKECCSNQACSVISCN